MAGYVLWLFVTAIPPVRGPTVADATVGPEADHGADGWRRTAESRVVEVDGTLFLT